MKRKELEQLKKKNSAELSEDLKKKKDQLWQLQVDLKAGKVKNVREVRSVKKAIAVIHTLLKQPAQQEAK